MKSVQLLIACVSASLARVQSVQAVQGTGTVFYFDNGLGETKVDVLNPEDEEILRQEIPIILGLNNAPLKGPKTRNGNILKNKTAHSFLNGIYTTLTREKSESGELKKTVSKEDFMASPFKITPEDAQVIIDSDMIMTFPNYGHQNDDLQSIQLFWFNTSNLPDQQKEEMIHAEIRLFKGKKHLQTKEFFDVECYQLVEGSTEKNNIIDTAQVKIDSEGWLSLNIIHAVREWQLDYHTNKGLMVKLLNSGKQLHPAEVGMDSTMGNHLDKEPFMVVYFKNKEDVVWQSRLHKRAVEKTKNLQAGRLGPRHTSHQESAKSQARRRNYYNLDPHFRYTSWGELTDYYGGQHKNRHCQIRMLRVAFKELGWQDWILAPTNYEAGYCHGECLFPLESRMNATNHAIVQTLSHLMNPRGVPKPKCAPTDHADISVLYLDDSSNVILKKLRDMTVKSCGCH